VKLVSDLLEFCRLAVALDELGDALSGEMDVGHHRSEGIVDFMSDSGREDPYGFLVEGGLVERRPGVGLFVLPLDVRRKRDVKRNLLAESLGQSAALAVQLGLDAQAAAELFVAEFDRMKSELEKENDE
jgi:hypothetical protein